MPGWACNMILLGWDEGPQDPKGQSTGRDGRSLRPLSGGVKVAQVAPPSTRTPCGTKNNAAQDQGSSGAILSYGEVVIMKP